MNLITRCPACSTMFRVVADQLRISEGWVRCGHCAEVFDAQANLQDPQSILPTIAVSPPPASPTAPAAEPKPASVARAAATAAGAVPSQAPVPVPAPAPVPTPAPVRVPATAASAPVSRSRRWRGPAAQPPADTAPNVVAHQRAEPLESEASGFIDTPVTHPGGLEAVIDAAPEPAETAQSQAVTRRTDAQPVSAQAADAASIVMPPEPELAPSFLLEAQRRRARSPLRRAAWGLLSLVFLSALLLQVVVSERDRIAAKEPQALALLTPLCEVLKCAIGPVREISSVRIDSSTFNKIRGDLYRFAFTVSSSADLPLAVPHMELTLTDEQDRVLARRVLTRSELPGSPEVMAPRAQWSGQWAVSVVSADLDGRVAGYRLLAFYP